MERLGDEITKNTIPLLSIIYAFILIDDGRFKIRIIAELVICFMKSEPRFKSLEPLDIENTVMINQQVLTYSIYVWCMLYLSDRSDGESLTDMICLKL